MSVPLIFIGTYTLRPGRREEYLERFREVADIVRAEEPGMLYFAEHVSEDGTRTSTVQVHAEADNLLRHIQLVGDHIREAAQYVDFSTMRLQIFGSPSEALLEQLRRIAGSGASVTVSRPAVHFDRFRQAEHPLG